MFQNSECFGLHEGNLFWICSICHDTPRVAGAAAHQTYRRVCNLMYEHDYELKKWRKTASCQFRSGFTFKWILKNLLVFRDDFGIVDKSLWTCNGIKEIELFVLVVGGKSSRVSLFTPYVPLTLQNRTWAKEQHRRPRCDPCSHSSVCLGREIGHSVRYRVPC